MSWTLGSSCTHTVKGIIMKCPACHSTEIVELHHNFRKSIRSDGGIAVRPLRKFHCIKCGLGIGQPVTDEVPYHRSDGSSIWQVQRHQAIAEGVIDVVRKHSSSERLELLEVGAANWETSRQVALSVPAWSCTAIEPFPESVAPVGVANLHCYTRQLSVGGESGKYDVIFSNNVMEHVPSSIGFLEAQKASLKNDGMIIVCCPASDPVSEELLFDDHLFHFTHQSFMQLCAQAGLEVVSHFRASWDETTQVYILAFPHRHRTMDSELVERKDLLYARERYFAAWERENRRLATLVADRDVVLFGTGEFAQLMQAYMPDVMATIHEACATSLKGARDIGLKLRELKQGDGINNSLLLAVNDSARSGVVAMLVERGIPREALIFPEEV